MSTLKKGDKVYILDYPFGRPINVTGVIVGILSNDYYNVKIEKGLPEGNILRYKYWNLSLIDEKESEY
jgi:hypothetical protein